MGAVVSSLFQLILRVLFKLAPDRINKGLAITKVLSQEGLELWLCNRNGALIAALMLGLSEADDATEKSGGKQGTIYSCGARYLEIIFTLLIKMVAVYMGFFGINLQGPGFK